MRCRCRADRLATLDTAILLGSRRADRSTFQIKFRVCHVMRNTTLLAVRKKHGVRNGKDVGSLQFVIDILHTSNTHSAVSVSFSSYWCCFRLCPSYHFLSLMLHTQLDLKLNHFEDTFQNITSTHIVLAITPILRTHYNKGFSTNPMSSKICLNVRQNIIGKPRDKLPVHVHTIDILYLHCFRWASSTKRCPEQCKCRMSNSPNYGP